MKQPNNQKIRPKADEIPSNDEYKKKQATMMNNTRNKDIMAIRQADVLTRLDYDRYGLVHDLFFKLYLN
jgi:hypothetical protein